MALTTPIRPAKKRRETTPSTPFDGDTPPESVDTGAEPAQAPPVEASTPKKKPGSRVDPENPPFFQKVANIRPDDWGTRAFMYVYCTEPICNLKILGENKYLFRSSKPILDVQEIMEDYGSMKGYITLNLRKTGTDGTDERDRHYFEIYNPKYPPKIPRRAWLSDPRNERWAALLPPEKEPEAAGSANSIAETMRLLTDIRRDVREEIGEPEAQPQSNTTAEMLAMMKASKELFGQPTATAAPAKDPLEIAVALFQTMNQMKAENPVIDMYRDELKAMRDELKEAHAEMRRQKEAPASKPFMEQLFEMAGDDGKVDKLKKVFGLFGGGDGGGRVARTTGFDVVKELAFSPFGQSLGQGLGMLLTTLATNGSHANGAPQQPRPQIVPNPTLNTNAPPQENDEQRINRIGQTITPPMLYEYFLKDADGGDFAATMFDMWPEDYIFMRTLGAENIVNRYRQFAPAWAVIAPKEPAFIQFIQEFCNWNPNEDEGPAPGQNEDSGIVDLEKEEAGS